jgi:hypothetical protein
VTPLIFTPAEFGAYMASETEKWAKVDQGREHQGELSGRKHSALERCVVQHSKIWRPMSAMGH